MSDCCSSKKDKADTCEQSALPRKFACPVNERLYVAVEKKTILQHIKSPWEKSLEEEKYYFCDDPNCEVIYFGLKGSVINKSEVRTVVGKKENDKNALLCYCFGVSKASAEKDKKIKAYVTQQTKQHNCACDIRNPSGRCCLKDFPEKLA